MQAIVVINLKTDTGRSVVEDHARSCGLNVDSNRHLISAGVMKCWLKDEYVDTVQFSGDTTERSVGLIRDLAKTILNKRRLSRGDITTIYK